MCAAVPCPAGLLSSPSFSVLLLSSLHSTKAAEAPFLVRIKDIKKKLTIKTGPNKSARSCIPWTSRFASSNLFAHAVWGGGGAPPKASATAQPHGCR